MLCRPERVCQCVYASVFNVCSPTIRLPRSWTWRGGGELCVAKKSFAESSSGKLGERMSKQMSIPGKHRWPIRGPPRRTEPSRRSVTIHRTDGPVKRPSSINGVPYVNGVHSVSPHPASPFSDATQSSISFALHKVRPSIYNHIYNHVHRFFSLCLNMYMCI